MSDDQIRIGDESCQTGIIHDLTSHHLIGDAMHLRRLWRDGNAGIAALILSPIFMNNQHLSNVLIVLEGKQSHLDDFVTVQIGIV